MFKRTTTPFSTAIVLVGALALSHSAVAGRVILNNDEWTFTNVGFAAASSSTTTFAANLASYMNFDGGACNLLVYSGNFGLTGSTLNAALTGAGCSVTYNTGAFDLTIAVSVRWRAARRSAIQLQRCHPHLVREQWPQRIHRRRHGHW